MTYGRKTEDIEHANFVLKELDPDKNDVVFLAQTDLHTIHSALALLTDFAGREGVDASGAKNLRDRIYEVGRLAEYDPASLASTPATYVPNDNKVPS